MPDDETPRREPSAPWVAAGPETEARTPVMQGVRAALTILAGIAALEAITFLAYRLTGGSQVEIFILLGLLIAGGGLAVLMTAGARLPRPARVPFWAVGVVCLGISFVLWGATCGFFVR